MLGETECQHRVGGQIHPEKLGLVCTSLTLWITVRVI